MQVDVLVIGFGPAGAAAAIAAHDAGARVAVIEKTAAGGGNCRYSGGFLLRLDADPVEHLEALCFGMTPRDVLTAFAEGLEALPDWLGIDLEPGPLPPAWPHLPGASRYVWPVEAPRGPALWRHLDGDGRRFCDETGYEVHDRLRSLTTYLPRRANRPRLPGYLIFDERARLAGPLNGIVGTPNDYVWSADNAKELAAGWITEPPDLPHLQATLATYGAAPDEFGRVDVVALEPPLYAIETWPAVATASGGPRRDARARVLDEDGTPIEGLYAAGAAGSIWGHLTEHGGGLTDALVFGRIAGTDAAVSR